jgi:hypothetical protein
MTKVIKLGSMIKAAFSKGKDSKSQPITVPMQNIDPSLRKLTHPLLMATENVGLSLEQCGESMGNRSLTVMKVERGH